MDVECEEGASAKFWVAVPLFATLTVCVEDVYPLAEAVTSAEPMAPPNCTARLYVPFGSVVVVATALQPSVVIAHDTVAPLIGRCVTLSVTVPLIVALDAILYGPTKGPPLPPTPAGSIELVDVSVTARPRLSRPLPVWSTVPTRSADSASRLTTTPFETPGVAATRSAATPATSAAEADVPLTGP